MKRKNKFPSVILAFTVLALVVSLGLLACSGGVFNTSGSSAAATMATVSVTVDGGGYAGSRALGSDGAVATVLILVYDDVGARIGTETALSHPGGIGSWVGNIAVPNGSNIVFEAQGRNGTGGTLYAGRATHTVTGVGGESVTIAVVAATLQGGTIQGASLSLPLSTYVNTFAGSLAGTAGLTGGTGNAALFTGPYGLTTDGTNIYVADYGSNNIRKIVIATQVVSTFAGAVTGAAAYTDADGIGAGFTSPSGITMDGTYLYVLDAGNNIRSVLIGGAQPTAIWAGSGTQSAGATDGVGSAALFNQSRGITYYSGALYVSDTGNHKIRKVLTTGTHDVTTLVGPANTIGTAGATDGAATVAQFNGPQGITTDGTYLYVADTLNNKIRRILMADGTTDTIAGTGIAGLTNGAGTVAQFTQPRGITTDGTYLYVADTGSNNIRKILKVSPFTVATIAGDAVAGAAGSTDGMGTVSPVALFSGPDGITTDGTNLFVADYANNSIRKIQ